MSEAGKVLACRYLTAKPAFGETPLTAARQHVFISYLRQNSAEVEQLCNDLAKHGVDVWLDRNQLQPGTRWKEAIRQAIRSGQYFIACFSQEYSVRDKTYMNEEIALAVDELRQYSSSRPWFIPVLLSDCNVAARSIGGGETLHDIQWVRLYEDWDVGIAQILSVIKPISAKAQSLINALRAPDPGVRSTAASALGAPEHGIAVLHLIKALEDDNAVVRKSAAKALEVLHDVVAVPALVQTLNDVNKDVRRQAITALRAIGDPTAVPALVETLRRDADGWARSQAARALTYFLGKAVGPLMVEALRDRSEFVQLFAAETLGNIGERVAVVPLINALQEELLDVKDFYSDDGPPPVHIVIIEALAKLGDRSAVPVIERALKCTESYTRRAAERALQELSD